MELEQIPKLIFKIDGVDDEIILPIMTDNSPIDTPHIEIYGRTKYINNTNDSTFSYLNRGYDFKAFMDMMNVLDKAIKNNNKCYFKLLRSNGSVVFDYTELTGISIFISILNNELEQVLTISFI